MDILEFTFQSFWHFIGVFAILALIGQVILKIFAIFNIRKIGEYEKRVKDED